jgi:hypothetical protein
MWLCGNRRGGRPYQPDLVGRCRSCQPRVPLALRPQLLRRVGPEQVAQLRFVTSADQTGERKAESRIAFGVRNRSAQGCHFTAQIRCHRNQKEPPRRGALWACADEQRPLLPWILEPLSVSHALGKDSQRLDPSRQRHEFQAEQRHRRQITPTAAREMLYSLFGAGTSFWRPSPTPPRPGVTFA